MLLTKGNISLCINTSSFCRCLDSIFNILTWACSKIMKPKRDIGGENETVVIGEIVTPNKLGVLKVFKIV